MQKKSQRRCTAELENTKRLTYRRGKGKWTTKNRKCWWYVCKDKKRPATKLPERPQHRREVQWSWAWHKATLAWSGLKKRQTKRWRRQSNYSSLQLRSLVLLLFFDVIPAFRLLLCRLLDYRCYEAVKVFKIDVRRHHVQRRLAQLHRNFGNSSSTSVEQTALAAVSSG